jgi:hypothetical protein
MAITVPFNRRAISLAVGDELYLVAVLTADGKPFRPPEGQVLSAEALGNLRLEWRKVTVL